MSRDDFEGMRLYLHTGRVVGLAHGTLPSLAEILEALGRLLPHGGQGDPRYTMLHRSVVTGLVSGRRGPVAFLRGLLSEWSSIFVPAPHACARPPLHVVQVRELADRRLGQALAQAWGRGFDLRSYLREQISGDASTVLVAEAREVLGADELTLSRHFRPVPAPPAGIVADTERLIASAVRVPPKDLAPLTFTLLDALIQTGATEGPLVEMSIHAYGRRIFDAAKA